MNFGVEHRAKNFDGFGADATEPFGERIRAKKHHGARFGFAERSADSTGVRADEIDLQLANLLGGDADGSEFAEAGVDAVGGFAAGDDTLDDGARGFHALDGVVGKRDFGAVERDVVKLRESEIVASELDGGGRGHALLRSGFGTFMCSRTSRYFGGRDFGRPLLPHMTCVV